VVLNRAQVDKHSYYYSHYYGHYYGRYYGSQSHKHSGRRHAPAAAKTASDGKAADINATRARA
jgi:hypothetical protein